MDVQGLHHVALSADDAEKSMKFYTEALGGKVVHHFPFEDSGRTAYLVDIGGGAVVEILPSGTGEKEKAANWAHIALKSEDARASFAAAVAAGAAVNAEPVDMMLGTMAVCIAFVEGPDGEIIEFFQQK